ncbi:FAD dependent oxidoreductase [Magnetococcus marinus MC-1]|uniref:FAD dependent oxidoreductase n=1 Tax=Magnetococcus marinus (strain ATCC BAA-1437 / JCM 17883 / MC-1) TaxID=156889 RepID=A0LAN8_MAGMM|nr:glycerol-3-phosphate dehydrogenase/oxidase [Magnetococcus marinus]ABK45031.1 FAD dependent oxidoreductase [Magnetococcus marinus MC-1]
MASYDYDVAVVGGGIHGAGVAQIAAHAGWSCVVLEQAHVAAGTSSRSSKLIHGGLRYLQQMQFGLVRECLQERTRLLHVAPQLVRLIPFYLPVYQHASRPPWMIRAGLTLYAMLAGRNPGGHYERLPQSQWDTLGGLRQSGLKQLFCYYDAQTDDRALTVAVMASAQSYGAQLWCATTLQQLHRLPQGYRLSGQRGAVTFTIQARVVVNVAGPWIGTVAAKCQPPLELPPFAQVQGAHLSLPNWHPPGAFTLQSPLDGRVFFVLPWQGGALLGSTETPFDGDPAQAACTPQEQAYLLESAHPFFPQADMTVGASFAGIRVLPKGDANRASREALLPVDDPTKPRLVTLIGGKLTSYHPTARAIIKRLQGALPPANTAGDPGLLPLPPTTPP